MVRALMASVKAFACSAFMINLSRCCRRRIFLLSRSSEILSGIGRSRLHYSLARRAWTSRSLRCAFRSSIASNRNAFDVSDCFERRVVSIPVLRFGPVVARQVVFVRGRGGVALRFVSLREEDAVTLAWARDLFFYRIVSQR